MEKSMSDDGTFSIRLVDENGDALTDRKVTVFYKGILGGSEKRYTDYDGWAEFPTFGENYIGEVYSYELRGILVTKHSVLLTGGEEIYDGATFSFTIQDE